MTGLSSFHDNTSKRVLDLLETGYLRLREFIVERITVISFGVNDKGISGTWQSTKRGEAGYNEVDQCE